MYKRTIQYDNNHSGYQVTNEVDIENDSYPVLAFQPNNTLSMSLSMHHHHQQQQQQQKLKEESELPSDDKEDDGDSDRSPFLHNNGHNHNHNQKQRPKATLDKRRAPKLAVLLFLTFFTLSGFDHAKRHIPFRNSPHHLSANTTGTHTDGHPPLVLPLPHLPPNLDNNGKPILIPPELSNLADLAPLRFNPPTSRNDIPLFWHIPRTGGSTIKDIFSFCLRLTVASEVGGSYIDNSKEMQDRLEIVVDADTGAKFLNVDTNSLEGIDRAAHMGIAYYSSSDLVVVTPYLLPAVSGLFHDGGGQTKTAAADVLGNEQRKPLLFTLLRHPIERAVSMYYYLAVTQPALLGNGGVTSIDEYVRSGLVENNWMTRFLVGKMGGELAVEDETRAKEILKTKCLIGLLERKAESYHRFKDYFGWEFSGRETPTSTAAATTTTSSSGEERRECVDRLLNWDWTAKYRHVMVEEGSEAWDLLREQNTFDLRLYEYAKILFEHQREFFSE